MWDRADLANLPSPSQARGQSQAGPAWLCTAHARPTPAAIQRGDPLTRRARVLALQATIIWELRFRFASPMKRHILALLLLPQNQNPATSQSSQERHPLETSPAADGAPEDTCISVLFWLWKSQPQDTITSLEKSPKTVCPDWDTPQPVLPWQAKQERSPHPELPEGSMLEWAELTQHLQPQLPSCCLLWQAPRNRAERGHILHLTPPLCTAPARFKTRGLSLSSWQPFPRPWGHPSLLFS